MCRSIRTLGGIWNSISIFKSSKMFYLLAFVLFVFFFVAEWMWFVSLHKYQWNVCASHTFAWIIYFTWWRIFTIGMCVACAKNAKLYNHTRAHSFASYRSSYVSIKTVRVDNLFVFRDIQPVAFHRLFSATTLFLCSVFAASVYDHVVQKYAQFECHKCHFSFTGNFNTRHASAAAVWAQQKNRGKIGGAKTKTPMIKINFEPYTFERAFM